MAQNTAYNQANSEKGWKVPVIEPLKKSILEGFSGAQFFSLVQAPEILTLVFDILDDNSISQQQKQALFAEIKTYLSSEDFQIR